MLEELADFVFVFAGTENEHTIEPLNRVLSFWDNHLTLTEYCSNDREFGRPQVNK